MNAQEKLEWAKLLKDILLSNNEGKQALFNTEELVTVKKILMTLIGGLKV